MTFNQPSRVDYRGHGNQRITRQRSDWVMLVICGNFVVSQNNVKLNIKVYGRHLMGTNAKHQDWSIIK